MNTRFKRYPGRICTCKSLGQTQEPKRLHNNQYKLFADKKEEPGDVQKDEELDMKEAIEVA